MRKLAVILFLALLLTKPAYCYDDERTHRDLTGKAISASSLSSYLKNNLGVTEGTAYA